MLEIDKQTFTDLASNFSEEEFEIVLQFVPERLLLDAVENRLDLYRNKYESIKALINGGDYIG